MTEKVDWASFEVVDEPKGGGVDWGSFEVVGADEKPSASSALRRAGDYGISALKGAIAVPEAAVGLADIVTGGRAGKLAEEAGFRPKEAKSILDEYYSPEQQAANKAVSDAKGFTGTVRAAIENPSVIAQTAVESLPSMALGGLAGRGIASAGKVAPWLAGAAGEGVVGAGSSAESIRQNSADGFLTAGQTGAALASGAGTAAFGAAGGRIAQRLGIADIDTMLAGGASKLSGAGVAKRIVAGGISEGAFEEMPQSAQEQVWQNAALGRPLLDGVPEAAGMGFVTGTAMGGIAGGAFKGRAPAPTVADIGNAESVDEAIAAATAVVDTPAQMSLGSVTANEVAALERDAGIGSAEAAPAASAAPDVTAQELPELSDIIKRGATRDELFSQREAEIKAREQETRDAGLDQLAESGRDLQVEQAQAITSAQGFDIDEPTAIQLAMQQAIERRKLMTTPVSKRIQAESPQVPVSIDSGIQQNIPAAQPSPQTPDAARIEPSVADQPAGSQDIATPEQTSQAATQYSAQNPSAVSAGTSPAAQQVQSSIAKQGQNSIGLPLDVVERNTQERLPLVAPEIINSAPITATTQGPQNDANTAAAAVPVSNAGTGSAQITEPAQPTSEAGRAPIAQPAEVGAADTGASGKAVGTGVSDANVRVEQQPALTGIKAEVARIKAQKAATAPAPQQSEKIVGRKDSAQSSQPESVVDRRKEVLASLDQMTGKQLRDMAKSDRRIYVKNAIADILEVRNQTSKQKRSEAARKVYARARGVNTESDSMSAAIAKMGGINAESASGRLRLTPEELSARAGGIRRVFSKTGRTMDEMGAILSEMGYVKTDENGKHDQTDFEDKLAEAANGAEILTPQGMMKRAQEEYESAQQEVEATSPEDYDAIERYADDMPEYTAEDVDELLASNASLADGLRSMGFSEQEIQDEISRQGAQGRSGQGDNGSPSGAEEEGSLGNEAENFALEAESEQDARKRLAETEAQTRAKEIELKLLEEKDKQARIQKEIDARQQASADNFQLGQSAEDALSGQGDLLESRKEEEPLQYRATAKTETPKFKRWFGDSKVVDANGKPLVVYHGTKADFSQFEKRPSERSLFGEQNGFYFTAHAEDASGYAQYQGEGANVQAVYLKIENPLRMDGQDDEHINISSEKLQKYRAEGYDGIIVGDFDEAIVFDPTQIKSATGNNGNFDPTDLILLHSGLSPIEAIKHIGKKLDEATKTKVPEWLKQMPQETQDAALKAGIYVEKKPLTERLKALRDKAIIETQQGLFDQFAPLKELGEKEYVLARLTKSADAPLEAVLMYGKPFLNDAGAIDVNTDKGGLIKSLQQLQGEHDRFFAWMAGNRAAKLKLQGRENLFTDTDISALKDLNSGNMPDGKKRALMYEKAKLEFGGYSKSVLDIAEKAGIINGADRAIWESDFYVPFYRVMEDQEFKGPKNVSGMANQYAFKKLKGGTDNLNDLMQNTLKNWSHLLSASLKNQAAQAALKSAEKMGVATNIGSKQKGSVFYLENGEQKHFAVEDAFILDAITSLEFAGFNNPAMKAMTTAKHYLTLGVTVSPTFKIRNLIRDQLAAVAVNPVSYNVMQNMVDGWKGTSKESQQYAKMLTGGGLMRFGTFLEDDRASHMKRLINSGVDKKTILDSPNKAKAALVTAWDWWQEVGDRSENITRASIYKQRYDQIIKDGKTADEAHLMASFAARDSMDFSLQGKWASIRFLTQLVPFMNARLQGLYKIGRDGVMPSGRMLAPRIFGDATVSDKTKAMRFGAVTGAVALASVALMLAYRDDDDWKEREEWDKDTYWWFKIGGTAYRIPKPFEIGAIGTIAERGLDTMLNGFDKESRSIFLDRMVAMVSQTFSMNPVPQLFKPLIDLYANKDSFSGRPIETPGMENLSKSERIGANTSATAQAVGKVTSLVGVSPAQVDFLVNGYFSWLGTHSVMTVDFAMRPLMGLPEKPTRRWPDDYFVLGDFAKGLPSSQSKYMTDFYDQSKKVQEAMADIRYYQSMGNMEKAIELRNENADKIRMAEMYSAASQRIGEINKRIKLTQARNIDPDLKREQIDRLSQQRNRLAKLTEERRISNQERQISRQTAN